MKERESTTIRSAVINKAINYIFNHIEEDITVEDVARHCAYSIVCCYTATSVSGVSAYANTLGTLLLSWGVSLCHM